MAIGLGPKPSQEFSFCGNEPHAAQDRLHDDRGDPGRLWGQDGAGRFEIVIWQEDGTLQHAWEDSGRAWHHDGRFNRSGRFEGWSHADLDRIVGAVVAALDLGDLWPAGEGSGSPNGQESSFAPAIRETDLFHRGDAFR